MEFSHPVFQDMLKSGCRSQAKILLAFQTYLELCEVHLLEEVEYFYTDTLDLIYLKAKDKQVNFYIPLSTFDSITPLWIDTFQKLINKIDAHAGLVLVIREADSTSVHYKVGQGLVAPPSPEETKRKRAADEENHYLESEIRKRSAQLYSDALLQLDRS